MLRAILFFFILATPIAFANAKERRPNVILIMADDVSWECFSCYGAQDYKTPHLDRLAAEGIRFEHCYSTPVCTTSRVKIMTGKYGFRNYTHFGYLSPKERTFGQMMQQVGYKTAIAGKWQLNGLYNQLEGHQDSTRPLQSGFDESLLWQVTKTRTQGGERFWNPRLEHNGKPVPKTKTEGQYGPDLFTDFVCDFIERNQEEPFFVYYPMVLVHSPFVQTPTSLQGDSLPKHPNRQPKDYDKSKANFVEMVQYMDKLVGRITEKVDSLGLGEDTIILFTADNGTHRQIRSRWNDREIQGGKGGMKDSGTHVPLIARWTGHTPVGKTSPDLVDFTDFYPTLADAARVQLGADDPIDGVSFFPQLEGKPGKLRDWVLCHYQCYWNITPGQFARTATYKLYRDGRFYNVPIDLDESKNLAEQTHDADALAAKKQLRQLLERCPPSPEKKQGRYTKNRPLYPEVENLLVPRAEE